jgi:hypothetical protein
MKKILILFLAIIPIVRASGQDIDFLKPLNFLSKDDYRKYENEVHLRSNYILNIPVSGDSSRMISLRVIRNWASGTPDYHLPVDQSILSLAKNNDDMIDLYIVSMTKWVLENKSDASSEEKLKLNSFLILLDYCADPGNKVRITKNIQSAIDAKNDGKLQEYLSQ